MNVLYLILIAISFSAGILTTVFKADTINQSNPVCIENNDNCVNENKVIAEPEADSENIFLILEVNK